MPSSGIIIMQREPDAIMTFQSIIDLHFCTKSILYKSVINALGHIRYQNDSKQCTTVSPFALYVLKPFLAPNLTNIQEHQQLQAELCESFLPLCPHPPPAMVMAAGWRNPKNTVGGSAMSFIMTTERFHMSLVLFGGVCLF